MLWRARTIVKQHCALRARRPQLKRDPLDGAMPTLLRWGKEAFIASTILLFVFTRVEAGRDISGMDTVLMATTALMLPFAFISVWRTSDSTSRRNWIILLCICLLLIAAAVRWHVSA